MRRVINKGSNKGKVQIIKNIWSDRCLREFMDICDRLNLGHGSVIEDLTVENEIEFVKAFYSEFDAEKQFAVIHSEIDRSNGFTVFLIEIWQRCEDVQT